MTNIHANKFITEMILLEKNYAKSIFTCMSFEFIGNSTFWNTKGSHKFSKIQSDKRSNKKSYYTILFKLKSDIILKLLQHYLDYKKYLNSFCNHNN